MGISIAKSLTGAAAAAAAALLLTSPASARPTSIRGLAAQEVRLATMAYRIAAANASLCKTREVITGLVLHDLTRYDRSVRPAVARAFSIDRGFGVIGVVPGSAAADAGLQIDDEILAVGPFAVEHPGARDKPKSFQRMEQFSATLQSALKEGQTDLLVRRRGQLLRLPLRAQHGCGGKLTLMSSPTLNAWADGKNIVVTTGMAALSRTDDEIAFVIAHEMAHNILGHARESGRSWAIFGSSRIKRGEIEADAYAVGLMANAGYQPAGGISFLVNARRRLWWSISLDHPGFGRRIGIVAAAMRATDQVAEQPIKAASAQAKSTLGNAVSTVEPTKVKGTLAAARAPATAIARLNAATQLSGFQERCDR